MAVRPLTLKRRLSIFFLRIKAFEFLRHCAEEGSAQCAIHNTMVVRKREVHHVADSDGVAIFRFDHHRSFFDGAYGQYGHLRLVDDGCTGQAAKGAHIGEGESTVLGIFRFQAVLAGGIGQMVYLPGQAYQVEHICIFDHRHDQVAAGQCSSHADIDILFDDDLITIQGAVHQGETFQAFHHCFYK